MLGNQGLFVNDWKLAIVGPVCYFLASKHFSA